MVLVIVAAVAAVAASVCGLISHWLTTAMIERTTLRAIADCPPEKRATILRAAAELASRLHSERRSATSLALFARLFDRSPPKD